jgi:hypothetical protein
MHQKDILVIRLGVAVAPIAQRHHLTEGELLKYLTQLFPGIESRFLVRAASIGAAPTAA